MEAVRGNPLLKRVAFALIFFLWAMMLLWPLVTHPDQGPMPLVEQDSDFIIVDIPVADYVHTSVSRYGQIPLWNTTVMSGQPFAGDYQSGFFYPPNWLTYWQPHPWMFTLLFFLHLAFTGFGFFMLMKAEEMQTGAGLFAALAWMATPRLIGYIGGGQEQLVLSISWTPWLLLAFRQAFIRPGIYRGVLAGAILAITFVANVQWGIYAGIFAGVYGFSHFRLNPGHLRKMLPTFAVLLCFAFSLSAGLSLPMLEFMGYSRRATLAIQNAGDYAIETLALLGLIFPQYGLLYELVIYIGIGPFIFSLFGMIRRKWFWLGAALFAVLFSLGSNAFLYPLLNSIFHIASWLRVPSRIWFIAAFSLVALAGWGLEGIFASLATLQIRKWVLQSAMACVFIFSATNLLWYDGSQLTNHLFPVPPVRGWLESQPGLFRVYSPDGSIPLPSQLQQANGANPMHLATYASYLGKAANMDIPAYSISLPNIYIDKNTPPDLVESASHPNAAQLGLLNVKFLVSKLPLQAEGIRLVQTFGDTRVYENLLVRPRAWLEGSSVDITYWSPNRIELSTAGPAGTLVLSEIMYPGWQAWVDGKSHTVKTVDGLLRGVDLAAGKHQVVFEFNPPIVYVGMGITIIGWVAFIFIMALGRKKIFE